MKIAAIIAEYNPFHNGHKFHIEKTKEAGVSHTVCILGGNFTQRGETSIVNKWAKAKAAIENGIDVVIEFPHPFCIAPAKDYASYAVSLADALCCIDLLSFGSESGNINELISLRDYVDSCESKISELVRGGTPYPAARQMILENAGQEHYAKMIQSPNNILAIEYMLAAKNQHTNFDFITTKRSVEHNNDCINNDFCSASFIRKNTSKAEKFMPKSSYEIFKQQTDLSRAPIYIDNLDTAIISRLRSIKKDDFANAPWTSEGLHNRIYEAVCKGKNLDEIVTLATSKRYTSSRIRRILIALATNIRADDISDLSSPPYIRVLGLGGRGNEVLRAAKSVAKVPIINKTSEIFTLDSRAKRLFELECNACDLYTMGYDPIGNKGLEMTENVYSVKG